MAALSLAAIMALGQAGVGISQLIGGSTIRPPDRPEYAPPQALSQLVANNNREASASMAPGQAQAQEQARITTANNAHRLQQVGSSGDLVNGIGNLQLAENRSMADIYQRGLSYQQRAKERQASALGQMAGAQDRAWDYNFRRPYDEALSVKSGFYSGGMTTLSDAIGGVAATAANQGQPKQPVPLPSAPQAQNYSLPEITNMSANESWLRLQEKMRMGLT